MKILKNRIYRIKGNSQYFNSKYGTPNPLIRIIGPDTDVFHGKRWIDQKGNMACELYRMRAERENLPSDNVWAGHIVGPNLAELVHESELEGPVD